MTTGAVGLLGGSFDPVHVGHLRAAMECAELSGLSSVRLVPLSQPGHRGPPVASDCQRLAMLELAVSEIRCCEIDRAELERGGVSYTVETLEAMREQDSVTPLAWIVGGDSFASLTTWHRWEELLDFAHLVVVNRPGTVTPDGGPLAELLRERGCDDPAELAKTPGGRVFVLIAPGLDISSTMIRDRISAGRDARFLVPPEVLDYIHDHGLYRL